MSSCILFHGPSARQAALDEAPRIGRLIAPPFGDAGLKAVEAREFAALMRATPLGDGVGVVIAGPMDNTAAQKGSDVLLKCVEEFNPKVMYPLLWAHDLNGVMGTIRSRCLDRWCPGEVRYEEPVVQAANQIVSDVLGGRLWKVPALVAGQHDDLHGLLGALSEAVLPRMGEGKARELWERLRPVTRWRNPTVPEVVAAMFPQGGR